MVDWNKELTAHRLKYGVNFMLPDGQIIRIEEDELPEYLEANRLRLHTPSEQGASIEDEQVGIKHA